MEEIDVILVKRFVTWIKCIYSHDYRYLSVVRESGLIKRSHKCRKCDKIKEHVFLEFDL